MLPGPTKLWGLRKAFWPLKYIPYVFLKVLDFSLLEIYLLFPPRTPGLAQFRLRGGGVVSGGEFTPGPLGPLPATGRPC